MVEPFRGFFTKEQLIAAGAQATRDLTQLSDQQLRIIACYDFDGAQALEQKRAAAIEADERTRLLIEARARSAAELPVPVVPAVTQAHLDALLEGIGDGVAELVKRLRTQITALETANGKLADRVLELEATVNVAVKK